MPSYDISIKKENLVKHGCAVPAGYVRLSSVIARLPAFKNEADARAAGLKNCDMYSLSNLNSIAILGTGGTGGTSTGARDFTNALDIAIPQEEVVKYGCQVPNGYVRFTSVYGSLPVYSSESAAVGDGLKKCDPFLLSGSGDLALVTGNFAPSNAGAVEKKVPYFDIAIKKEQILFRNCNLPKGYIKLSQVLASLPVYSKEKAKTVLPECGGYLRINTVGKITDALVSFNRQIVP
jgi:hypothetical protein|tara:strand:- start:2169 stop:2873 length:705 start_codon:yes stop_codon:yes gene_type:complete